MESLCSSCTHVRQVTSGTGSTFLLCLLAQANSQFRKYPPQPVVRCMGYESPPHPTQHKLELLPEVYAICRFDAGAELPRLESESLLSVTRTPDELSVVCSERDLQSLLEYRSTSKDSPGEGTRKPQVAPGWRCLRVAGTLEFEIVGVLAELTGCLADSRVSLFALSTFDTDYLLVKADDLEAAVHAFVERGHSVSR